MAVTVTRGKTHTKYARMLANGANLSGDSRSLGSVGMAFDEIDVTGWEDLMNYLPGQATLNFGPYQAVFSNKAAATGPVQPGVHTSLSGIGTPIATAVLGIREAPTIGAPAFSANLQQMSYTVSAAAGGTVIVNADFSNKVGNGYDAYGWGQILANGTSVSSTTTNGSLDNGASSANGAYGVLHITTSAGAMGSNNWAVKIQDSANDSTWADLITFTANGSTATAEWGSVSGTVDRYTRVVMTKTGGTDLVAWVNLIRL